MTSLLPTRHILACNLPVYATLPERIRDFFLEPWQALPWVAFSFAEAALVWDD